MAFKPNYGQERAARNRAKDQKKQEKLQRRQEESERRKAERGLVDFEDLLSSAISLYEDDREALGVVQARSRAITVDEAAAVETRMISAPLKFRSRSASW